MTQSSTETGGTGSQEGQGQQNQPPGGQGQQDQGQSSQDVDFDSLPEATKTEIRRLRRENKQLRKGRAVSAPNPGQQGQQSQDTQPTGAEAVLGALAKALGVDLATGQPPASDTKQTTAPAASSDSDHALRLAAAVPVVYTVSGELGANPAAVLDSRSFLTEIRDLDPTDADFAKDVKEAVQEALTRNAALKATGATPPGKQPPKTPKSGGDLAGGRTSSGEPDRKSPQQRLSDAYAANSS
jgi:hypothetical protein